MNEETNTLNQEEEGLTLGQLFHIVWKNIILMGIITAIITLVGIIYTVGVKKPTYQSTATLVVKIKTENSSTTTSTDVNTGQKLIKTIAQLATSDVVLDDTIQTLALEEYTTSGLANQINVGYTTDSFIISISAETINAELSQKIVNGVSDSLIKVSNTEDFDFINGMIVQVTPGKLGTYASPNKVLYTLISFIGGFAVACVVVFIKEICKVKINDLEDVEKNIDADVFGAQVEEKDLKDVKANLQLSKINKENYEKLMTNIEFSNVDANLKVIAFTSSSQGEGKSSTVFNLALLMGMNHKKVLVVDLDLRRSKVHRYFGVSNKKGVTDYTTSQAKLEDILIHYNDSIDIITSGGKAPNPTVILNSSKMKELFDLVRSKYDYILVDCPPTYVGSDVLLASKNMDGFIYVIAAGEARIKEVNEAIKDLKKNNINVLGIDVTRLKKTNNSYYYKKYYYNSAYHYGNNEADTSKKTENK